MITCQKGWDFAVGSIGTSNTRSLLPWMQGYMTYRSYIENDNASTEVYFDTVSRGVAFGNSEMPQTPLINIELHESFRNESDIRKELERRWPNKRIIIGRM